MALGYEAASGVQGDGATSGARAGGPAPGPPGAASQLRPSEGPVAILNHALIVVPLLLTGWLILTFHSSHKLAYDFHDDFWVAGSLVRHGLGPYGWTPRQITELVAFPYPAPAALVFVPFSFLRRGLTDPLAVVLLLAAGAFALRLLRVRDWRVYTVVLLWSPVVSAWQTANLTLLIALGAAAMWRYRESPVVPGVIVALMLALKPIVWPLLLWLVVSRRYRAAVVGVGLALVLNAIAWAVLGFGQFAIWWHLIRMQSDLLYRTGYGLTALVVHLGAGHAVGTAVQVLATATCAIVCLRFARQGRDREAFTLAIVLMLVGSPLVDNHYFALLIVPLAIVRPYFSRVWLAPLVLWLCPAIGVAGWQVALFWATAAALVLWVLRQSATGESERVREPPSGSRSVDLAPNLT